MELTKKQFNPAIMAVVVVTSLIVGFGGGVWYQRRQVVDNWRDRANNFINNRNERSRNNPVERGMMNGQGMGGARIVAGEVTSKDDKSLTVKLVDGSSRIVLIGSSTQYTESTAIEASKLVVGSKVAVFGTVNSDGTTVAESIELNPSLRGQN